MKEKDDTDVDTVNMLFIIGILFIGGLIVQIHDGTTVSHIKEVNYLEMTFPIIVFIDDIMILIATITTTFVHSYIPVERIYFRKQLYLL